MVKAQDYVAVATSQSDSAVGPAKVGVLLDCHLEFEGAGRRGPDRVYKRNDVLRVVE